MYVLFVEMRRKTNSVTHINMIDIVQMTAHREEGDGKRGGERRKERGKRRDVYLSAIHVRLHSQRLS